VDVPNALVCVDPVTPNGFAEVVEPPKELDVLLKAPAPDEVLPKAPVDGVENAFEIGVEADPNALAAGVDVPNAPVAGAGFPNPFCTGAPPGLAGFMLVDPNALVVAADVPNALPVVVAEPKGLGELFNVELVPNDPEEDPNALGAGAGVPKALPTGGPELPNAPVDGGELLPNPFAAVFGPPNVLFLPKVFGAGAGVPNALVVDV
jgi:hypothetical protein